MPERFTLERKIGMGAFGDVWSAFDAERGERVALKLLRPERVSSLAEFKKEFRQLADVVHPNLVTLYELFALGDRWFFTMEYVDGVDFLQFVRRPAAEGGAELDVARLDGAFPQLVEGVAALHDRRMVHRDLKPTNVLVTSEGRVVVLDFGLVTDAPHSGDARGYLVGAPAYLAPEVAAGHRATPASDWYAVGTMLFESLTGRLPFEGPPRAVLRAKREDDAPDPSTVAAGLPRAWVEECNALLKRDPEARGRPRSLLRRTANLDDVDAPFIGRRHERGVLWSALEEVIGGTASTVFLDGPSGSGKTALLGRFLEEVSARHPNALILRGRCHEHEAVPYQAVDGAVDALARALKALRPAELDRLRGRVEGAALSPLFPVLAPVLGAPDDEPSTAAAPERRRRGFSALRELFGAIACERLVVLAADDLQWGDVDGASLLAELTIGHDAPAILVIASFRGAVDEDSACLRRLHGLYAGARKEVRRVSLDRLPADDALALARALRPDASPAVCEQLLEESQGHPFFLTELARASEAVPALTIGSLLERRLRSIAPDERHLLEFVAIAARPPTHDLLIAAASGAGAVGSPLRIIRRLRAERLVSSDTSGERVDTYHDRVRQAVASLMSAERRLLCHRSFAQALERSEDADHELLVHHWRDAGQPAQAARHAISAGERADAAFAFDRAAGFYSLALELVPLDAEQARPLRERLGEALWNAGQGQRAADAFLAASRGAKGLEQIELKRRAAESLLYVGSRESGEALLEEVLGCVGLPKPGVGAMRALDQVMLFARIKLRGLRLRRPTHPPASEQARRAQLQMDACYTAAQALGWSDPTSGPSFILRGLCIALDSGDVSRAARFLSDFAVILSVLRGDDRAAAVMFDRALAFASQSDDASVLGKVKFNTAVVDVNFGRFRQAIEAFEHAIALMREECIGVDWDIYNAEFLRMGAMYFAGDHEGLLRDYPRICQEVDARGNLHAAINIRLCTGFRVELLRNRPEEALRVLDEAVHLSRGTLNPIQEQFHTVATVDVLLHLGRRADAAAFIEARWPVLRRSPVMRVAIQRQMLLDARARALA